MKRSSVFVLGLWWVAACGGKPGGEPTASGTSEEASSTGASTTGEPPGTTTMTPETAGTSGATTGVDVTTTTSGDTSATAVDTTVTSGPPPVEHCDGLNMPHSDCPEGQKCTIDGAVSQTHCVPVVEEPKGLYEPCQILMGDAFSGHDDCGPGLLCWDVDPDTGVGTCIGFCEGPPEDLGCADPASSCTICQDCAVGLCLAPCDPLEQDCPEGSACIPNASDFNKFVCVIDASGEEGQAFDPCEYTNACDPGLLCLDPELAAECDPMAPSCCVPLCDTTAAMCPGAGQECLPWFEQGQAPPGLETVGVCGVP